ncbi:hypothetical protein FOXG_22712 [Fusarium oxysporum f. sp. lycopersici 4287]|uniref:Zn(2)-C6 fungal-type domain-containing protein n=1 Tax=Fusarium oxysporum f. sp. lycopersici (strain 4287 / CBS 123668 / FGSC 9935 / NRRL 34936) TaxID=426428 RepID=A0A0J9WBX3_FUSO4|nr:hypothetical protein FOXG_22712 [Fusarium oxysporum f. sp. lycopersici 4287]KNB20001.1 hypothetical protein FOXG_22712 [Fusarium oxysporum f. sp. lycopersici 4287]
MDPTPPARTSSHASYEHRCFIQRLQLPFYEITQPVMLRFGTKTLFAKRHSLFLLHVFQEHITQNTPTQQCKCSPTVQAPERTNTRASQACDNCRKLKAKCDDTKLCTTCKKKGAECKYRDPVPKPTDKAQVDILEAIGSIHTTLDSAMMYLGRFDERLIKIESFLLGSPSVTNGASTNPANFIATPVPQKSLSGTS